MRFTPVIVTGIFALAASAQSTDDESVSSVATSAPTTTRALTPEESLSAAVLACLEACDASDVNCQARCITVPNPDENAVNRTTECVAECPQGDGTEAETQRYIECSQQCINDYFMTTTFTGGPTSTGAASSGSATATATPSAVTLTSGSSTFVSTVTPSASSSGSPSATESSSDSESTADSETEDSGAFGLTPLGSTGLLGLVAAFLAAL